MRGAGCHTAFPHGRGRNDLHYLGTGVDEAGRDQLNEGFSDDAGASRGHDPEKTPPEREKPLSPRV
jgi:hypothetical protein